MNISQYWKVLSLMGDESLPDEQKSHMIIATLNDVDVDSLLSLPMSQFMEMAKVSQESLESLNKQAKAQDYYELDGNRLRLIRSGKQMNAIQFIHLMAIMHQEDINKRMHSVCALMLMPENVTYPDYNVSAVEQLVLQHMDIRDIFAIVGEASGLFSEFPKPIREYLVQVKKQRKIADRERRSVPVKMNLVKSGGQSRG